MPDILIRPARSEDADALWGILGPIIGAGETYALDRAMGRPDALAYWLGPDKETFVATDQGEIVGTYYLRANQSGGGAHVANAGYATSAASRGRGVARKMCAHSLDRARQKGFSAMQFNFVVSSNVAAVTLWQKMGFEVVGRLPGAFIHPVNGETDALVMFRHL